MQTYALYKLIFKKVESSDIFDQENDKRQVQEALELLEQLLKSDMYFMKKCRNGDGKRLEHQVEAHRDHVLLLMLKNNKSKHYLEGRDERNLEYHPGCYVIFDCREGVAQLAIECIASFDGKPDKVSTILSHSLNMAMRPFGLALEIRPKMSENDFWTTVEKQTHRQKDAIRRVSFEFPKRSNIGPIDAATYMQDKLIVMQSMLASANAAKGQFRMEADKGGTILLDRTRRDVAELVSLCCRNGYSISVYFRHYGVYRFGEQVRAFGQLHEEVINQFIYGQTVLSEQQWALIEWLDEIRERTMTYNAISNEKAQQ